MTLCSCALLGEEWRPLKRRSLAVILSSYPFSDVTRESLIGFSRHCLLLSCFSAGNECQDTSVICKMLKVSVRSKTKTKKRSFILGSSLYKSITSLYFFSKLQNYFLPVGQYPWMDHRIWNSSTTENNWVVHYILFELYDIIFQHYQINCRER